MRVPIDGHRIHLTSLERDLFAVLFNARGVFLTWQQIHEQIYRDREDGGAGSKFLVRKVVETVRRKLAPTLFCVVNQSWHGYALKRLNPVRVPVPQRYEYQEVA